jgi:hypothetical protein
MHADAFFTRGQSHRVCQDYACAGASWALVSDGCSSSLESDWGARLLARAAAGLLEQRSFSVAFTLEEAQRMQAALRLPPSALDATLLCAWRDDDVTRVSIAGDGYVTARRSDGRIECWAVRHEDGAPPYPSYLCNAARLSAYLEQHGSRRLEHGLLGESFAFEERHLREVPYVIELALPVNDYPLVAVASDGAASFEGWGPMRVLEELVSLPSTSGCFVLRRCRRFLREARAQGIRHHDDLSFAALSLS